MFREYTLTVAAASQETIVYKLHKTKDGYWNDHPLMEKPGAFLMMNLKKAIAISRLPMTSYAICVLRQPVLL